MTQAGPPIDNDLVTYRDNLEEPAARRAGARSTRSRPHSARTTNCSSRRTTDTRFGTRTPRATAFFAGNSMSIPTCPNTCVRGCSQSRERPIRSSRGCPPPLGRFAVIRFVVCAAWRSRSSECTEPRVLPDDNETTQDFVFVNHKVFPTGDAKDYLTKGVPLAWVLARTPDRGMLVVNAVLRGANRLLKRFGARAARFDRVVRRREYLHAGRNVLLRCPDPVRQTTSPRSASPRRPRR